MESSCQSTKDKILNVALDMFSTRGYSSVSIRDISRAIGIKESSIYYHFKNKQDIFEHLLYIVQGLIESMKTSFNNVLSVANEISQQGFVAAGISYIEKFLLAEQVYSIINMLSIEKSTNAQAADYYVKFLFDIPLEHHQQVYTILKQKCMISNYEPDKLASEYQSIILFIFFKYFPSKTYIAEENLQKARNELSEMLMRFYSQYLKGSES